ncbi:hypothetical protein ACFSTC_25185 [Nonomuraea ferruginea]
MDTPPIVCDMTTARDTPRGTAGRVPAAVRRGAHRTRADRRGHPVPVPCR